MTQGEATIIAGAGAQTGSLTRWGDYSAMSVDPTDDCTFWYTNEYIPSNGTFNWQTRIASFKFPGCGPAPTVTSVVPANGPAAGGTTRHDHGHRVHRGDRCQLRRHGRRQLLACPPVPRSARSARPGRARSTSRSPARAARARRARPTSSRTCATTGATYVSLTPARILDTRIGTGLSGPFSSGVPRTFAVTGHGGVPVERDRGHRQPDRDGPDEPSGYVALTPAPTSDPTTSTLNFPVGDNRANGVTVALSGTGTLLGHLRGRGRVGADDRPHLRRHRLLRARPPPAPRTSRSRPARILDTRIGTGLIGPFTSGRRPDVRGDRAGRGARERDRGHRQPDRDRADEPAASSRSPRPDQRPHDLDAQLPGRDNRANGVTVALGDRHPARPPTWARPRRRATPELIFDVTGYFVPTTTGATYVSLTPARILDYPDRHRPHRAFQLGASRGRSR